MNNATILTAPKVDLKNLDNLFIELTHKNCNLRCKHCYIEFEPYKKIKDFIPLDIIKQALDDIKILDVKMIYLTGGEPLIHPDFNQILRLCLKSKQTTIISNGLNINDKKSRFLRKVEDEGENELFFQISLDSYDERKNDDIRGRGSFRKTIVALQSLIKYDFVPLIRVVNYYKEPYSEIHEGFLKLFQRYNIPQTAIEIKVYPFFDKNKSVEIEDDFSKIETTKLECANSRILSSKGVYTCPILVNDFRARVGSDLKTFSDKNYLETQICTQCLNFSNSENTY